MAKYQEIQINTDGGSRGNPGPSAVGILITSNGQEILRKSHYIGITTNNVAEYTAVNIALDLVHTENIISNSLNFVLDSELVVNQINGQYKIKQKHLQEIYNEIQKKVTNLKEKELIKNISFSHTRRENNRVADSLVNSCLDSQ